MATQAVEEIVGRGKLPIVVGGTNYYIEGLLFEKGASTQENDWTVFDGAMAEAIERMDQRYREVLQEFRVQIPLDRKAVIEEKFGAEGTMLHDLLRELDPKMGEYFHSKDKRRVINALFKALKCLPSSGAKTESELILSQQRALRYYPVLIWMRARHEILEQRITKRIAEMVGPMGGLNEIFEVFSALEPHGLDFEKGILQAIGYKEFYPYYLHVKSIHEGGPSNQTAVIEACKEALKRATIKYTVYQIKWLTKRISQLFPAESEHLLAIDLNDPKLYESHALSQSLAFFHSH